MWIGDKDKTRRLHKSKELYRRCKFLIYYRVFSHVKTVVTGPYKRTGVAYLVPTFTGKLSFLRIVTHGVKRGSESVCTYSGRTGIPVNSGGTQEEKQNPIGPKILHKSFSVHCKLGDVTESTLQNPKRGHLNLTSEQSLTLLVYSSIKSNTNNDRRQYNSRRSNDLIKEDFIPSSCEKGNLNTYHYLFLLREWDIIWTSSRFQYKSKSLSSDILTLSFRNDWLQ